MSKIPEFVKKSTMIAAYDEFKLAYVSNAFGNVDWRYRLDQGAPVHFNWLSTKLWTKLQDFDPHNHFVKRHTLEQCLRALQHEEILNT